NVVLSSTYVGKILGADQLLVILCYRYQKSGIGYWILSMTISGSGMTSSGYAANLARKKAIVSLPSNKKLVIKLKVSKVNVLADMELSGIGWRENWLLVTTNYSQKDPSLVKLLTKPLGDVFNMITGRWTGKSESLVDPKERDQTKRLVYGILYGMGANSLADQLECSPEDAGEKNQSFTSSFPGVASWLKEAVVGCRKKG
ncbi:helicase and polymerase-containing protein TEBICHI isoform X1, partial [Tanacetum coccineum]